MASVTVYTADRMQAIEDSSVVSGTVDPVTKKLMLTTRGGTVIDGGVIQGAKGDKGDPGAGNVNTVNTKLGPDVVLTPADLGALPATQFATEAQRGIIELATTTEAAALTDPDRGITPFTLAHVKNQRWEKTGSTIAALGNGLFAGQTALLTLASNTFPVEIVWTGSRWEPVSWKLSGSNTQRSAFETSGVCYEGVEWYSTTDKLSYLWSGTVWTSDLSGLKKCVEYTTTRVGGSSSTTADGRTVFASVTSISFDNVFSAKHRYYKIFITGSRATGYGLINLQTRKASVNNSAASYYMTGNGYKIQSPFTSPNYHYAGSNNLIALYCGPTSINGNPTLEWTISNPFVAAASPVSAQGMIIASDGSWYSFVGSGLLDGSATFDGFTLFAVDGVAISGEIHIFAYN